MIELNPIKSHNVVSAGYDPKTQSLAVRFKKNGRLYEYSRVPESVWKDFLDAQPHPWKKVGEKVILPGVDQGLFGCIEWKVQPSHILEYKVIAED